MLRITLTGGPIPVHNELSDQQKGNVGQVPLPWGIVPPVVGQ
jgi:hypothetical protein